MTRFASLLLAVLAALALTGAGRGAGRGAASVEIDLVQLQGESWLIRYEFSRPLRRLDLGPALEARARDWRVLSPGLALRSGGGRDYLYPARRGETFREAEIVLSPRVEGYAKNYEIMAPFGRGGAVFYTGHVIPWAEDGRRMPSRLDVTPRRGSVAAAFGRVAAQFENWQSPHRHPAFIYVGPRRTLQAGEIARIDPATPEWAAAEFEAALTRLLAWYEGALGQRAGMAAPARDIFLAMGRDETPGRLAYRGDALPGQFLVTLDGGGWAEPNNAGRRLLRQAAAHEAAHLFQADARPKRPDVPDWIHEGAADALAAEALIGAGLIAPGDGARLAAEARAECESELAGAPLERAAALGRWRAVYACGHAMIVAAARAHNPQGSAALFWRDFLAAARAEGGYDEALFYALVEASGGRDTANAMRRFAFTRHARPAQALERLVAETRPLDASDGG